MTAHKLSNLQLELLKIYSFNVKDEQLLEIKNILGNYFADKVTEDIKTNEALNNTIEIIKKKINPV